MTTLRPAALLPLLGSFLLLWGLSACGSSGGGGGARAGVSEWRVPTSLGAAQVGEYRIGALDLLNITVFQVEDLTLERVQVDAAGNLQMPLIGALQVRGLTTAALAEEITRRLAVDFLQNPQVSIAVVESASQKVTVDGAVVAPGVFQMKGNTTLLQAVAMASGPSRLADLRRVAVFRTVEGQRMVALYDLGAIRRGQAEDPSILGDDVVVVDSSAVNTVMRDIIGALPVLGIFTLF